MSAPTDVVLFLQAVRTLGYADAARIAERLGVPEPEVVEQLLDAEASGWVTRSSYAGDSGWSMTEAGKRRGEHLLAVELDGVGARGTVEGVYRDFLPVNGTVTAACTAWQLAEMAISEAPVDLSSILRTLSESADTLASFEERLAERLPRFVGYHRRYADAVLRAADEPAWITGTDRDSCHRVWFELHEDLIATLGLER